MADSIGHVNMTVQNFAHKQPFALDLLLPVLDFCRIPHAGLELTLSLTTASLQRESCLERQSIQKDISQKPLKKTRNNV